MKKIVLPRVAPHHIPPLLIVLAGIIVSTGLVLTLMQRPAPATTGNIYVSPEKVSSDGGQLLQFAIRITPDATIDTVTATASYDMAVMTYQKATYEGSPFSSQIPASIKDNTITVQSALLGGKAVQNDSLITTLTFKATKSGSHDLVLTYGNAAHAGIPTNPTVMGRAVAQPQAATTMASPAQPNDATSNATSTAPLLQPAASLLRLAGVSPQHVSGAAPWLTACIICVLLAVITFLGMLLYKKVHKHKLDMKVTSK